MAFSDDFTGTNGDLLKDRTGWSDNDAGSGASISTNALGINAGSAKYWRCTDQADADNYTQARFLAFNTSYQEAYVATRVVDASNFVGVKTHGTGVSGRRVTEYVSGTGTDVISLQGADDEWCKIEVNGTTVELYLGGTGASPSWPGTADDSATVGSSTETKQGIVAAGSTGAAGQWINDFEAGVLSGGATTHEGSTTLAASATLSSASNVTFSATISLNNTTLFTATNNADFESTLNIVTSESLGNNVNVDYQGAITLNQDHVFSLNGGLDVAASISIAIASGVSFASTITIEGAVSLNQVHTLSSAVLADYLGDIGLGVQASQLQSLVANYNGVLTLAVDAALSTVAAALFEVGLSLDCISSITQDGSTIIVAVVTPDSRTITIKFEDRTFTIH